MELWPAAQGGAEGLLLLPFSLALEAGAALRIGDAEPTWHLCFRTCLPVGCLVSIAFDGESIDSLAGGTLLTVVTRADGGEAAASPIRLDGFAGALDRTASLLR